MLFKLRLNIVLISEWVTDFSRVGRLTENLVRMEANTKCQPTNYWYYVFYLKTSHKAFFPFFAQSIYRSTFLFRNILHIPTGFDTLDILNLFFTFQKNSLYSNKIALGVVLTYLNLSQIFKLKLGS